MEAAALLAAIALAEKLIPIVDAQVKSGEVSADEQLQVRARYQALRDKADSLFSGDEWNLD